MIINWLQDTNSKIFLNSVPAAETAQGFRLLLAKGERRAFQIGVRNPGLRACRLRAAIEDSSGFSVRLRRIGYVPLRHLTTDTDLRELDVPESTPGYVPDPLFNDPDLHLGPFETGGLWVDVQAPGEMPAGTRSINISLKPEDDDPVLMTAQVEVADVSLPVRKGLNITHWLYPDAIADWYKMAPMSNPFWEKLDHYLKNMVEHGIDTLFTPFLPPPVNGDNRPIQLLGVCRENGRYGFDWTMVRRWIRRGKQIGFRYFEWSHLFSQWGAKHALRVYEGHGEEEKPLWPERTPGLSDEYRAFLTQLLEEWEGFLREEEILDKSFFHISDEPDGDEANANYRLAATFVREKAPWLSPTEAVGSPILAKEGIVGRAVCTVDHLEQFRSEGVDPWVYYCCNPRGNWINRFMDTPLWKIRMLGWVLYRSQVSGFLHWGYNYWQRKLSRELVDPFTVSDAGQWPSWSSGDPFVVYPGNDGPLDSIRWEVFGESMQDYALLQAAWPSDAPELQGLKSFADFPRDPQWIEKTREKLLVGARL